MHGPQIVWVRVLESDGRHYGPWDAIRELDCLNDAVAFMREHYGCPDHDGMSCNPNISAVALPQGETPVRRRTKGKKK